MTQSKIVLYLLVPTLFLGASCTQTATNTNTVSHVNESANVEATVNTNTTDESGEEEVGTSGWKTYTNEEYGFSFRYPKEWGEIIIDRNTPNEYEEGGVTYIKFTEGLNKGLTTVKISIETLDYRFSGPTDGERFLFNSFNLNEPEDAIVLALKRNSTTQLSVKKITTQNGLSGVILDETGNTLAEEQYHLILYLFPNIKMIKTYNMTIYADVKIQETLTQIVDSFYTFNS